ncbi:hypothetical protein D3C79_1080530 [compost metagenome]
MALPRPDKPTQIGRAGFIMEATAGEHTAKIGTAVEYPIDVDALSRDLGDAYKWLDDEGRRIISELDRLGRT